MKSVTYTVTYERGHWRARSSETMGAPGSKSLTSLRRELIDNASWLHGDTEDEQVEITFVYDLP